MQPEVLVYCGPGAGARSVASAVQTLKASLRPSVQVRTIGPAELLVGDWQRKCKLFVLPGGADSPYCVTFKGRGNQLLREYVKAGGAYLGLCAGAYYACSSICFEPGSRLAVAGERELAFFPGSGQGAVHPGFQYETEHGAVCCRLSFRAGLPKDSHTIQAPADCTDAWQECVDYSNGGPSFQYAGSWPSKRVRLLATYSDLPQPQHEGSSTAEEHQEQGPAGRPAAAVACEIGSGVAVLCGTHPELHPDWLLGDGQGAGRLADWPQRTQVAAALRDGAAMRQMFWLTLLHECRLGALLSADL